VRFGERLQACANTSNIFRAERAITRKRNVLLFPRDTDIRRPGPV